MVEENSLFSSPTCDHDCDCSVYNKHRGKSEPAKTGTKGQFNSVKYNNVINDYKQVCNTLIVIC